MYFILHILIIFSKSFFFSRPGLLRPALDSAEFDYFWAVWSFDMHSDLRRIKTLRFLGMIEFASLGRNYCQTGLIFVFDNLGMSIYKNILLEGLFTAESKPPFWK